MIQRKIWKSEEDEILKKLYQNQGITKWSKISRMMRTVYGMEGRNGKQCRERYYNHLKEGINKNKWTKEEENLLITLHGLYGNRWALISKQIEGRTQHNVKNMLFSILRKSVRQLNRFRYIFYRRVIKEIQIGFIYKISDFTENIYKKQENERNELQRTAINIKNEILKFDFDEMQEITESQNLRIKSFIEEIHTFNKASLKCKKPQNQKQSQFILKINQKIHSEEKNQMKIQENTQFLHQVQFQQKRSAKYVKKSSIMTSSQSMKSQRVADDAEDSLEQNLCKSKSAWTDISLYSVLEPFNPIKIPFKTNSHCAIRTNSLESNVTSMDNGQDKSSLLQSTYVSLNPSLQFSNPSLDDWASVISNWNSSSEMIDLSIQ